MCQDCIQHSLRINDSSTSCGKTKLFHCVNINMINISAGILLSLMVRSWYVTGRVCVRDLVCVLYWDASQRFLRGESGRRAGTLNIFGAETNQGQISKERLSMPPRAEGCSQVCVGAGGAEENEQCPLCPNVTSSGPVSSSWKLE